MHTALFTYACLSAYAINMLTTLTHETVLSTYPTRWTYATSTVVLFASMLFSLVPTGRRPALIVVFVALISALLFTFLTLLTDHGEYIGGGVSYSGVSASQLNCNLAPSVNMTVDIPSTALPVSPDSLAYIIMRIVPYTSIIIVAAAQTHAIPKTCMVWYGMVWYGMVFYSHRQAVA